MGNQRRRAWSRVNRENMVDFGPVDLHRHDERAGFFCDQARAVVDFHQAAGDGQPPFGKDHERFAGLDRVDQRARAQRLRGIERNGAGEPQEGFHPPALRNADVDREDRVFRQDGQDGRRVEEAHVIERDDRIGPRLVEIFESLHVEPVKGAEKDREDVEKGPRDDGAANPDCGQEGERPQAEEKLGQGGALALQKGDAHAAERHEGRVMHIDGSDRPRALFDAALSLDGRESRHDHQPSGEREHGEVDRRPQRARLREIVRDAEVRARLACRAQPFRHAEIGSGEADEHGADRGRQKHDAALEQKGGEARAHGDGDGEDGQMQRDDAFRAMQRIGDERGHQRHGDGAEEPEETRDGRQFAQHRLRAQRPQQFEGRAE